MTPGAQAILDAVSGWQQGTSGPLVVAIDGYGGSGKTTITREVARALQAPIVETDRFLRQPPQRPPQPPQSHRPQLQKPQPHAPQRRADLAPLAAYYAWHQLRTEALIPATASGSRLVLVDGVSSAAPALADLVTRTVFVHTPEAVRLQRLRARIAPEEWDEHWLAAERRYFASRPPESFDLVVPGVGSCPD